MKPYLDIFITLLQALKCMNKYTVPKQEKSMWFKELAYVDNPGRKELRWFVQDVRHLLLFILEDTQNFGFLWQHDPSLHGLAIATMKQDIAQGAGLELDKAISQIDDARLRSHGLEGRPLKFRLQVLNSIANQWKSIRRDFSVREWLNQVIEAVGAILDPLIDAANGAGRLIKEFKQSLVSLA
jgi:hypothetical protein